MQEQVAPVGQGQDDAVWNEAEAPLGHEHEAPPGNEQEAPRWHTPDEVMKLILK